MIVLDGGSARHAGSLPLLRFALTELYDLRVDGVIGQQAMTAIGGLAGAIGRRAEDLCGALDKEQQTDARNWKAWVIRDSWATQPRLFDTARTLVTESSSPAPSGSAAQEAARGPVIPTPRDGFTEPTPWAEPGPLQQRSQQ